MRRLLFISSANGGAKTIDPRWAASGWYVRMKRGPRGAGSKRANVSYFAGRSDRKLAFDEGNEVAHVGKRSSVHLVIVDRESELFLERGEQRDHGHRIQFG